MKNAVDNLIQKLVEIIKKEGLQFLDNYPDDLLVHDRRTFERFWAPGQRFGWMVGHCHSHMAAPGNSPGRKRVRDLPDEPQQR